MQYPIKWKIEFPSSYPFLESLAGGLAGSHDAFLMVEEDDDFPPYYTLGSAHIEAAQDDDEARKIAGTICCLFSGAFQIFYREDYHAPRFGPMYGPSNVAMDIIHPDGVLYPAFSNNTILQQPDEIEQRSIDQSFISRAMFTARKCSRVYGILSFIGANGITWVSLYGVLEYLRTATAEGWDEQRFKSETKWSNAKYKSFTGTANSSHHLGPFARHAKKSGAPMKNPMTRQEAVDGIMVAAQSYIDDRYKRLYRR